MVTSAILYSFFANSEVQPWNFQESHEDEKELMVIKKKNDNKMSLMIQGEEKQ